MAKSFKKRNHLSCVESVFPKKKKNNNSSMKSFYISSDGVRNLDEVNYQQTKWCSGWHPGCLEPTLSTRLCVFKYIYINIYIYEALWTGPYRFTVVCFVIFFEPFRSLVITRVSELWSWSFCRLTAQLNISTWVFLKIGVSPNHPF